MTHDDALRLAEAMLPRGVLSDPDSRDLYLLSTALLSLSARLECAERIVVACGCVQPLAQSRELPGQQKGFQARAHRRPRLQGGGMRDEEIK
jgi:hypothetical protein